MIAITKNIKNKININIIVAGKQNISAKKILNKKNLVKENVNQNFKIFNRFIYTSEENYLFSKIDAVWCVYKNTPLGSSGVFHASINYHKPVITNDLGLVGWYNKKYKLGPILEFNGTKNFETSCRKIVELYKDKKKYQFYKNNQLGLSNTFKKQNKLDELIRQFAENSK